MTDPIFCSDAGVAVPHPHPVEITLSYPYGPDGEKHIALMVGLASLVLGGTEGDPLTEAAAMDRLAECAREAARWLRKAAEVSSS